MPHKITRRQFLRFLSLSGMAAGVSAFIGCQSSIVRSIAEAINKNFLPVVLGEQSSTATPGPTPPPGSPVVVHAHNPNATSWNYSTGWYGNYINQSAVNQMIDEGLKALTNKSNLNEAWSSLLPGYSNGKAIAIKVNFNNADRCNETDNIIDALIEPVNALIRGMLNAGVQASDIWIYDAIRALPTRFQSRCLYPNVRFFDAGCATKTTFVSKDPNAYVTFNKAALTPRRVADVIINASYLINMPIIKDHGFAGVTLGFKNHFGTIDKIMRDDPDNLHLYIDPGISNYYSSSYNPLIDIYANPHIRNKTILVVGDGLFGAYGNTNVRPEPWQTFNGHAPNSIFLSTDPVAIDCIMLDILDAEPSYHPKRPKAEDYLKLAASAGMGVYERGDPWGSGYSKITYTKLELA